MEGVRERGGEGEEEMGERREGGDRQWRGMSKSCLLANV